MRTLKNMFSGSGPQEDPMGSRPGGEQETPAPEEAMNRSPSPSEGVRSASGMDIVRIRTVIQAPVLDDNLTPPESDEILIKAQPTPMGDQCLFRVNRMLFKGHSWWFPDFESADGSPLAEAVFSVDGVESVLVHESCVTVTRSDKTSCDWRALAVDIGAAIRQALENGDSPVADKIIREMPPEEKIREDIQRVIDEEVNPGVAGHGGRIALLGVRGNTITIQMGGGCQGCSAADVTLKMGIHNAFRQAVPAVGAIFDETDHAAGLNPYFS